MKFVAQVKQNRTPGSALQALTLATIFKKIDGCI